MLHRLCLLPLHYIEDVGSFSPALAKLGSSTTDIQLVVLGETGAKFVMEWWPKGFAKLVEAFPEHMMATHEHLRNDFFIGT